MDGVNSRIPQAYGYAVCFITVIMMLISIKQVVDAAFDLSDPIHADGGGYGNARFRAIHSLVGNLLLIALVAVLFTIHWRWLRKRDASPAAA